VEGAYDIGVVDVVGIQERSSSAEDTRGALVNSCLFIEERDKYKKAAAVTE
jgi:hypothetical protein